MANNSDVTIRGLQIAAELNIDASADIISGQLNELATKVNNGSQKLKLNVGINMGQPAIMSKQLNSQIQAAQAQVKPLDVKITAKMGDYKAIRAEVDKIAQDMAQLQGFDVGKVSVKTSSVGKLLSADIQYYKDGVNQAVTDTIRLVNATKKVPEHYTIARKFVEDYKKSISDAIVAQQKLSHSDSGGAYFTSLKTKDIVGEFTRTNPVLKQMAQYYREAERESKAFHASEERNSAALQRANAEREKAIASLNLLQAQFPKMAGTQFQAQFNAILQGLDNGTMSGKEANAQLVILRKNLQAAGLAGQTFGQKITAAFQKFGQYVTVSTIVLSGIRATKQMISNVVELDTSLVEFNKVADLTATQLEKITVEAFAMGESIGRTGKDVIDAATEFKRAGYDISESMDMARSALVMTNVGDGIEDTAEAASILIAALRGFEKPASEVSSIVDLINQVSNTSPIAFEDIAEGLTRVAGTMHLTGTSIEETIGLLTGGFSQLRNIEKVSSGLIMISQKLRGVDEDGTSVDGLAAKVADEFEAVGVSVEDTNGELRSTFDILKDYAAVYDELGSKKIQFLGEEAAGNRQVTVLNAIMQQWEDVEKAVSQATNSVGSAEKENAIFMDSIRGRLNELKSAWQDFSDSVVDDGAIKRIVTAGKDILNVFTALSDNLGVLPTALGLGGLVKLGANLGLTRRLLCVAKDGSHIGLPIYKLAA